MSEQQKGPRAAIKVLIVVALVLVVGAVMAAKNASQEDAEPPAVGQQVASQTTGQESGDPSGGNATSNPDAQDLDSRPIPKLVDLGAKSCVPCKMMAPILDELEREYQGKFDVVFIDVWENRSAGSEYGIRVIPTQIFFDADGEELFRHEGFMSKEDILGTWKKLNVTFGDDGGDKTASSETI